MRIQSTTCLTCAGVGRLESISKPGTTFECPDCEGTGVAEPDLVRAMVNDRVEQATEFEYQHTMSVLRA